MHKPTRRLLLLPAALLALSGLAGCNTVEGIGEDISALGQGIDNTASRHRDGEPTESERQAQRQQEDAAQQRTQG